MLRTLILLLTLTSSRSFAENDKNKSCLNFKLKTKKYIFIEETIDREDCSVKFEFFQFLPNKYRLEITAELEKGNPLKDVFPNIEELFKIRSFFRKGHSRFSLRKR